SYNLPGSPPELPRHPRTIDTIPRPGKPPAASPMSQKVSELPPPHRPAMALSVSRQRKLAHYPASCQSLRFHGSPHVPRVSRFPCYTPPPHAHTLPFQRAKCPSARRNVCMRG